MNTPTQASIAVWLRQPSADALAMIARYRDQPETIKTAIHLETIGRARRGVLAQFRTWASRNAPAVATVPKDSTS